MSDYCAFAGIITASAADTLETKRRIERHNLRYTRLCIDED